MHLKWFTPVVITIILSHCADNEHIVPKAFELSPGSHREIAYTDKQDAHWVTRAGGYNNSPWHGLTASKRGYFEDLYISAGGNCYLVKRLL